MPFTRWVATVSTGLQIKLSIACWHIENAHLWSDAGPSVHVDMVFMTGNDCLKELGLGSLRVRSLVWAGIHVVL